MNRWGPGASTERALYRCLYSLRNTRGRAKVGLSMATPADNKILVNSLLAGIHARQSDDRKLLLTSFAGCPSAPSGSSRRRRSCAVSPRQTSSLSCWTWPCPPYWARRQSSNRSCSSLSAAWPASPACRGSRSGSSAYRADCMTLGVRLIFA
jgi:hypothetical protein